MSNYDTESSSEEELLPAEPTPSVQHAAPFPDPDDRSSSINAPEDRYNIIYIIFFIQGIGMLLPWNFFITAKTYFEYKFQEDESVKSKFENAFALSAMFPSLISTFLNIFLTSRFSRGMRVITCLTIMFLSFTATAILVKVESLSWPDKFFAITVTMVVIVNFSSGIYQGTLFGVGGVVGMKYTQAIMGGQAVAGIFAAIADIISKLLDKNRTNPQLSAFIYFLIASFVIALTAISYTLLFKMPRMIYYFRRVERHSKKDLLKNKESTPKIPYWKIFLQIKWLAFSVTTVFCVTLSMFPGTLSKIASVDKSNGSRFTNDLFPSLVCFLIFNVGDWCGRTLAGQFQICSEKGPWLPLLSISRIVFIPLFLMCNIPASELHLPYVFNHDFWPVILNVFFAVTNGYVGSLCMMNGPKLVKLEHAETAGTMMSLFLGFGLMLGAVVSFAL